MIKDHYLGGGHIAIMTCDLQESIAFYEKLGGTVAMRGSLPDGNGTKEMVLMRFAGYVIELVCPAEPEKRNDGSIYHFALYVDDVDAAAAEVEALGINTFIQPKTMEQTVLFGGLKNRFFRGPSGEMIELLYCNEFVRP
ncbi:MAG: VOC family protein [Stomatobaculum sp.]|nr:VOC family protein [Stomatobaculum sp.]